MDNVWQSGAISTAPPAGTPVSGYPTDTLPSTVPGAYWFHMITQELLAVIEAAGITPSYAETNQLQSAIEVLVAGGAISVQNATCVVYQWATSQPATPTGAATYTWATGSFGAAPTGWSLTPGSAPIAGYTLWAASVHLIGSAVTTTTGFNWASATVSAVGAAGTNGAVGTPGLMWATAYLYQWSTVSPSGPTGTSTWTWSTGTNSAYSGSGWYATVPTNPGVPGVQLWVATIAVSATVGTTTSTVNWTGAGVSAWAQNGTNGSNGANGVQSATATVYQWALTIPAGPVGSPTWTWSTSSFGSAPSGWSLTPGTSPSAGYTLWAASVTITDSAANSTTSFNWTSASITARGYAGTNGTGGTAGYSATIAYAVVASSNSPASTPNPDVVAAGSLPANNAWGMGEVWQTTVPSYSAGQTVYQTNGINNGTTTSWGLPYISALKVGSLSAITTNTGALTVTGDLTMSSTSAILGGMTGYNTGTGFFLGYSGGTYCVSFGGLTFDGTTLTVPAASIGGSIAAAQITPSSGWINSNITLGSNGVISGAGGGAVTISGLGTTGVAGSGNLLLNSDFLLSSGGIPSGFGIYNNASISVSTTVYSGGPVGTSDYLVITAGAATSNTLGICCLSNATQFGGFKANTNYVLSFYAWANGTMAGHPMQIAWNDAPASAVWLQNPNLTSGWQRYVFLVNFGSNTIDPSFFLTYGLAYTTCSSGNSIAFACLQVEQGDAPSGWAPAPLSTANPLTAANQALYGYTGSLAANETYIDGSGNIQGVSSGAGTAVQNSLLTASIAAAATTASWGSISSIPAPLTTPSSPGLYLGGSEMGFYNGSAWTTYMDSSGDFFLGGSGGALVWNATLATLGIKGTLSTGTSPSVSGSTMTGSGAAINANGTFAIGNSAGNISYNGTTLTLNGSVVASSNIVVNSGTVSNSSASSSAFSATSSAGSGGSYCSMGTTTATGLTVSGSAVDGLTLGSVVTPSAGQCLHGTVSGTLFLYNGSNWSGPGANEHTTVVALQVTLYEVISGSAVTPVGSSPVQLRDVTWITTTEPREIPFTIAVGEALAAAGTYYAVLTCSVSMYQGDTTSPLYCLSPSASYIGVTTNLFANSV